MRTFKVLVRVFAALLACVILVPIAWYFGYISRVVVAAQAPDGRVEAVCRGRLPESTEYDLWLREGGFFGWRVGFVGTESMGRCRAIAWSPAGDVVGIVTEGGTLSIFDGRTGQKIGYQRLTERMEDGSYPSRRIVTRMRFESSDVVSFDHCPRLWHETRVPADAYACGAGVITERLVLKLTPPRNGFAR